MTNGNAVRSQTPQSCSLATVSLVLGILGLICLGPLTAIPAIICGHMARGKIKQSAGALGGDGLALGGLIMGYVGLVLFILIIIVFGFGTAAAMPAIKESVTKAQDMACINNLRQLEMAKSMWAAEMGREQGEVPTASDLEKYLPMGLDQMMCPKGGTYSINAAGQPATCSIPGHDLAAEE